MFVVVVLFAVISLFYLIGSIKYWRYYAHSDWLATVLISGQRHVQLIYRSKVCDIDTLGAVEHSKEVKKKNTWLYTRLLLYSSQHVNIKVYRHLRHFYIP